MTKKRRRGSTVEYLVKPGARITKRAVSDVGPVIEMLIGDGRGTAADLVAEAKNPKSPAHDHFEWNDARAAHQHRLERARFYFRSIAIVVEGVHGGQPIRGFWHIDLGSPKYEKTSKIRKSPDLRGRLVVRARQELLDWLTRYSIVREMAGFKSLYDLVERYLQRKEAS